MVLLEKANGLKWYFNGNHWNFCDGFYWASIVFFSREAYDYFTVLRYNKKQIVDSDPKQT